MRDPNNTRDIGPRAGTPLWWYLAGGTAAGAALLAGSLAWSGRDNLLLLAEQPLVWVVLCMVVLGELRPIATAGSATDEGAPTSLPFSFALLIFVGLPAAAAVQAVATLVAGTMRRHSLHRTAFNAGQYVLSLGVADAVLRLFHAPASAYPWVPDGAELLLVALAAAAYFVTNLVLVECAVAMHERAPLHTVLGKDFGQRLFVNGVLLGLAPLVVVTMAQSIWLVPLFALPLAALYVSATLSVTREHQANHDELTGLANRKLLILRTEEALTEARQRGHRVGLLLLDLDRFKEVNDTLGHPTGDRLLQIVALRLTHSVRPGDLVARLGGDEFAVLLPQVRDAASAREVAARLRVSLAEPTRIDGMDFDLEASVGIALFPEHAPDFEMLLQRADVAMYVAKERRTGAESYTPQKDRHSTARLSLFGELRRALVEKELEMFFQPTVDLSTRGTVGLEALVRWRHPQRGVLEPHDFVPLIEQSYLIRGFTHEVLEQTLTRLAEWRAAGHTVPVAVNLSARELLDPTLPGVVEAALRRHGVPAAALRLEISERVVVAEADAVTPVILALADIGVPLSLDDFGTGYFTLARLNGLPVEEIKVDPSFVRRIADGGDGRTIVASAVALVRTLGMRSVAEGVEDSATADALRAMGCDAAQGRFFAPPLEAAAVTARLRAEYPPDPGGLPGERRIGQF
ncbi:putative bifunctional diguanylate cyclase/phosphodiesterase [Nocardiopsis coralliicola]